MIAISYRREDSLPTAGRLYDRLQAKFGKENVFMDFSSIALGSYATRDGQEFAKVPLLVKASEK